tara:strand:- start:49 stop:792 length:744 start_codon:yes stop_codon:yes gene_type:complete
MKLYIAVSYLSRKEWAGDTAWAVARNGFELCLRKLVKNEGGDTIAAHTALYFENVDEEASKIISPFISGGTGGVPNSFFVDILSNGEHSVSVFDDPGGWYQKWSQIKVELFPVATNFKGKVMNTSLALEASLAYLKDNRSYGPYQNFNSVCPIWPTRCSPSFGCCCPCSNGTNCVEAVIVATAAGYGVTEWKTRLFFGLRWKTSLGARLPSELIEELLLLGVVGGVGKVLSWSGNTTSAIPLLLMRE